jgi:hypothetical protein
MAESRQNHASSEGCIPNVLLASGTDWALALRQQEFDIEYSWLGTHALSR